MRGVWRIRRAVHRLRAMRPKLEAVEAWRQPSGDGLSAWQAVAPRAEHLQQLRDEIRAGYWLGKGEALSEYRNAMFALAFLLAAEGRKSVSVCDFGGGIGNMYYVAKALKPDIEIDFHCIDLPSVTAIGAAAAPEIRWHADHRWSERTYDLVVCTGALQYIERWRDLLALLIGATGDRFLLTMVPTTNRPTFPARHWLTPSQYAMTWLFARDDIESALRERGANLSCRRFTAASTLRMRRSRQRVGFDGWLCSRGGAR